MNLKHKLTLSATIFSTLCLVATILLWIISYQVDASDVVMKLHDRLKVNVYRGDLSFYNQQVPYRGSIVSLSVDPTIKMSGFDQFGIYQRVITRTNPDNTTEKRWVFSFTLGYLLFASLILPALYMINQKKKDQAVSETADPSTPQTSAT